MFSKQLVLPALASLLMVFSAGCKKDATSGVTSQDPTVSSNQTLSKKIIQPLAVVNLGVAGNFAILSKSGITDVYKSTVTGDIGTSPITGAAIGLTCAEVVGTIYTVDAAGPLPCRVTNASRLTTAVSNMQTAYTDAAGRVNPNFFNLGAGNIGGKTLTPGLYKWTT
jgi:tetrahydromethanopterin S-methyltransferase subunit E